VQIPVNINFRGLSYRSGNVVSEEIATYFQGHSRDYNAKRDAKSGLRGDFWLDGAKNPGVVTDVSEYEHHGKWYEMPVGTGIVTGYRDIKGKLCSWIVTNHESDSNPYGTIE